MCVLRITVSLRMFGLIHCHGLQRVWDLSVTQQFKLHRCYSRSPIQRQGRLILRLGQDSCRGKFGR